MLSKFSVVLLVLSISYAAGIVNYCGQPELCKLTGFQHITCDATGDLLPSCPPDARVVELSDENIQQILEKHNFYRNKIAGGDEPGFNPAARMSTMTWDQDLADYAGLNARRCHDDSSSPHDCHNTPEVKYSGQNVNYVATYGGGAQYSPIPKFIDDSVNIWYNEKQYASQNNIDNCCGSDKIPHFLEVSNAKANKVGCAISQFTSVQGLKSYIVCNYSYTIITGQQVYESGSPGSKCATGPNPDYPNLCSVDEPVSVNDPWSY